MSTDDHQLNANNSFRNITDENGGRGDDYGDDEQKKINLAKSMKLKRSREEQNNRRNPYTLIPAIQSKKIYHAFFRDTRGEGREQSLLQ